MKASNASVQLYLFNAGSLCFFLGLYITMPFIPRYVVLLGASKEEVSLMGSTLSLAAMCLMPLSGLLINKGHLKKLIIYGLTCSIISHVVYSISCLIRSLHIVYAGRALQGISVGLFIPSSLYMSTILSINPANLIAWRSAMMGVAMVLGPIFGGSITSSLGYTWLFVTPLTLLIPSLLIHNNILSSIRENGPYEFARRRRLIKLRSVLVPDFVIASIGMFCMGATFVLINTFLPALHEELRTPVEFTATVFTANSVTTLLSRLTFPYLSRKFSVDLLGLIGGALIVAGGLIIATDQTSTLALIGMAVYGAGGGLLMPYLQILAMLSIDETRRGIASGLHSATFDAGGLIAPPLAILTLGNYANALKAIVLYGLIGTLTLSFKLLGCKKERLD